MPSSVVVYPLDVVKAHVEKCLVTESNDPGRQISLAAMHAEAAGLPPLLATPVGDGEDTLLTPTVARSTLIVQLLSDGRILVQAAETNKEVAIVRAGVGGEILRPGVAWAGRASDLHLSFRGRG